MAEEKPKEKKDAKQGRLSGLVKAVKKEKKEEKKEVKKETAQEKALALAGKDPYDILKFVLMTEKAVRQIELQNKLVFIVDRKSKKPAIKSAAEQAFNMPIAGIKTVIDQTGRKRAFIRFRGEGAAGEIAVRLGII